MALVDDFSRAQIEVRELASTPSSDELLALYSLYKQASAGDATGARPGMLDFKGRAKFDAWAARKGVSPESAMQQYVELVTNLQRKYGRKG